MSSAYALLSRGDDLPNETLIQTKRLPGGGVVTKLDAAGNYSYSYGKNGVRGLLHNRYALASAVFCSLGGLTFGYDQGVISNVLVMENFQEKFALTTFQIGLITAVLELGALGGALVSGAFADFWSRRQSISLACVIFCIGSILQTVADSAWTLGLGRAIGGIGIGALSMLCPLFIGEIASPETRGALVALEQLSIVLGVVLGFWVGFTTRSLPGSISWRLPLGIQVLPGVVLGGGSMLLPESPRMLVLRGDEKEAAASLERLRNRVGSNDPLVQLELAEMRLEAILVKESNARGESNWRNLWSPKLLPRTSIGVSVMFFQQWSGINALLYYGPSLMAAVGLHDETMLVMAGLINVVQMIAVVPAIMYLDDWGRKPLLKLGAIVTTASHGLVSVMIWLGQDDWSKHSVEAWSAVGLVYVFTAAYGLSFGPIGWVLPSEIFPLSIRSKGVALSTASNWLNNFLVGLITPVIIGASPSGTFALFACACAGAYIWAAAVVPETKGLSLEEIDTIFSSSLGRQDTERRKEVRSQVGIDEILRDLVDE